MEPTIGLAYEWNGIGYTCTGMGTNTLTDIVIASEYDDGVNGLGPVTSIRGFGAKQLTSVTIPSSVTNMSWGTFNNNQLTSVVWETTMSIPSVFSGSGNKITSFIITSDTLIGLSSTGTFNGVTAENPMTVYVQPQLIEDYKVATNWVTLYNEGRVTFEAPPKKSRKLGTLYANLESTDFSTLKAVKKETVEALVESDSLELNTLYVDNSESGDGSGGMPEAPIDGKTYGRQDGEWTNLNMLIDNSIQQAIEDVLLGEV